MTDAADPKKAFDKKKLDMVDRIRRDGRCTASTRMVAAEILALVNFGTGYAWAEQDYLAETLGLGLRTVKRAVAVLKTAGYFSVEKISARKNRYRPNFEAGQVPDWHQSENEQVPDWHQSGADRGQNGTCEVPKWPLTGAKMAPHRGQNGPLISLTYILTDIFSFSGADRVGAPEGAAAPPAEIVEFVRSLQARVGRDAFTSWFSEIRLLGIDGDAIKLEAPNRFKAERIKNQFERAVVEAYPRPEVRRLEMSIAAKPAAEPDASGNVASLDSHPARAGIEDARWLDEVGIGMVSRSLHVSSEKARKTIRAWLKRCGNDSTGLKRLIADASARELVDGNFGDVIRQGTRTLLHAGQLPLKGLGFTSVKRSA
jgi:hypothetical protein